MSDQQFLQLTQRLDRAVERLDGTIIASELRLRQEMSEMKLELKAEIKYQVSTSHDSLLSEMRSGFQGVAESFETLSELIDDDFYEVDSRLARL